MPEGGKPRGFVALARTIEPIFAPVDGGGAMLPAPRVLLVEGDAAGAMSYGYTANGDFCGDFWHESMDAAMNWPREVYNVTFLEWQAVPHDEPNAHHWAKEYARRTTAD